MLDSETKRRIDSCRDILVGKVPDPKSQVEQITIALIYKFMDDMDAEAEALGGKRSFFAKAYAKYGWSKLMAPNMGGFDVLSLYSEAIQKMNENPGVPPLFRDIFKNAYLPYRDPETLRIFLKEINGFTYDHSERLGDAFEYLLSVLGSQGEAGQFRTPRHIIDFMVDIIDPKKNETILDPACGTAGFLISSYKHILKHNSKDFRAKEDRAAYNERGVPIEALTLESPIHYKGDLLKPDDRKRLAANIHGYDISPDMVRLSLVNMYLHGFIDPHIEEYDTLTSDEKWNELADIILANPPFMSPKGGIKPHKRFSVQATRSEVLFVDYIAEHLTPNGRAAVIVPEGIIFQSGTAYKQLREMLMKNYLVSVISLPAGVFNPYAGVKTSILVLDKRLAKKTDVILFAKIENDGFNLGAQRRSIDKNDLPAAARNIKAWLESLRTGIGLDVGRVVNLHLVDRERIGENGEWSLSGERYLDYSLKHSKYEVVKIGDVCEVNPRKSELDTYVDSIRVSFVSMQDLSENHISFTPREVRELTEVIKGAYTYFRDGDVLLAKVTPCFENGKAGLASGLVNGIGFGSSEYYVLRANKRVLPEFIYYFVTSQPFKDYAIPKMTGTGGLQRVPKDVISEFQIPLPPLEEQGVIVTEIAGYQKIIDGARQIIKNYKPLIPIHPAWPMFELGSVSEWITKGTTPTTNGHAFQTAGINFIKIESINEDGDIDLSKVAFIDANCHESLKRSQLKENDILFSIAGTKMGITGFVTKNSLPANTNQALAIIRVKEVLVPRFVFYYLRSAVIQSAIERLKIGVAQFNLSLKQVSELQVPVPDLETQRIIVAKIDEEQSLVNANKELTRIFEEKIKATINRVWGETE